MATHWNGVFPAVTTQFRRDQSLDLDATVRHTETLIESGVHGLVVLGSLGENTTLSREEKRLVANTVAQTTRGRVPVLSGVAECSTADACSYAREMESLGLDGLMVLPGLVYKADDREVIAHFRAVARASGLPIICYNNPIAYGIDITPDMFAELATEPTLVAIKESSGDVRRITDLINLLGDRYTLFCGVDDTILEALLVGATGWIAGLVLAFPQENALLWQLASDGKWDKALELYRWYTPLLHLDTSVKFVQNIKLAMQECGLGAEWVRAPRLPLDGREREETLQVIRRGIETRPHTSRA